MKQSGREAAARVVGREPQLTALTEFVSTRPPPGALVLTGEAGAGKTTLWEAGILLAREQGLRVLAARPSGAEARLSFAALIDLFAGVGADELGAVPGPQLLALQVALLRAEPAGPPADPGALDVGFLNALRSLAAVAPLVLAVDDVQALDVRSADALAFVARRLDDDDVRFLLARRTGGASRFERALERGGVERLEIGPLSLGATRNLLCDRLGLSLPRRVLRRVVDETLGNPLFALEFGRALQEHGLPRIGEDMPVPDVVEDLLGARVARLPGTARRLLLALALSADLSLSQLAALAGPDGLDAAVDTGVLVVDGDRARPAHPLLAAVAKKRSRAGERRRLHLELAAMVPDETLRALHLALATDLPDEGLAATVARAAAGATARGATEDSVELAHHALRLSPAESPERVERLLALATYLMVAGEKRRMTDLLISELDGLPEGAPRARACLLLASGEIAGNDEILSYLERTLAESAGDSGLRAAVFAELASNAAVIRVERIHEAEAWALSALPAARLGGPDVEARALHALAWARCLLGRPIDDVCERFRVSSDVFALSWSPDRVAGQRLVWRGELGAARVMLTQMLARADERGEPYAYALVRLHMCELELRAGRWGAATRLLDEWAESSDRELIVWPMYERCRALLAAGRGEPDEAARWGAEAASLADETGVRWDQLEALRACGTASLLAHAPERAVTSLREVWAHTEQEGVEDPGAFPVVAELVEALVELEEPDAAQAATIRLRRLAEEQDHPWGLTTAMRCEALAALGVPERHDAAAVAIRDAAAAYERLGLRFDGARSLLALGRAQRRLKKWGAARAALEQAVAAFESIGSPGWAEEARSELRRVGSRRPQPTGELTPAESRVVELAVDGLANKEIARSLFVSVHTVEVHLSHAYTKLGIHSRAHLSRALSTAAATREA